MRFLELQAVVLAYLATSVSGLTIAGDHLIKPRDSSVGTDGKKCYPNPSQWQAFQDNNSSGDPQTTCYDEYPGSGHGTDIYVRDGCIVIDDSIRCTMTGYSHKSKNFGFEYLPYNVRDQDGTFSTAVIYAGFDRNNHDKEVEPNCVLEAKWPSYWGDLDFTKDGCLTDSSGEWKQCCFNNPNGLAVTNPYA